MQGCCGFYCFDRKTLTLRVAHNLYVPHQAGLYVPKDEGTAVVRSVSKWTLNITALHIPEYFILKAAKHRKIWLRVS